MNKWISVNDRLPDNSNVVLAYNLKNSRGIYIHKIYFAFYYEYRWTQSNDAAWKMDVTHWMPLPNPPEEESEPIGNTKQLNANELDELLRENPSFIISLQNKCEMQEKEIAQLKDKLGIKYASIALQLKANNKIKEQAQEIADLKISNQDLKYQLIQKAGEQVLNDFKELIDEDNDLFRKEQVEKFYAEARPLREKYKLCELTDEEIEKVYSSIPEIKGYAPIYEFARAILKKASEK